MQSFLGKSWHGASDGEMYATEYFSLPVCFYIVVLFELCNEEIHIFFACILVSEIVNNKAESEGACFVSEKSWCELYWFEACFF